MIKKITALMIVVVLTGFNTFAIKQYTLEQLKENPLFEVSILANGSYSGNSIVLEIKSKNKKDVELIIPSGTVFYTSDEGDQILIVVEELLLVIVSGKTKKKTLDGFCTEASDGIPDVDSVMHFMPTKREKLQLLANFINENKGFDDHVIQEAVWCVSDGHSLANIYSDDRNKSLKLTKFVSELTGQEVPWHTVKRILGQSGGQIQVNPILVTGLVHFSTAKKITLKSKIIDSEGNLVYQNTGSMEVPITNDVKLDFNLTVAGWSKGTYVVVYYDQDNTTIFEKKFDI